MISNALRNYDAGDDQPLAEVPVDSGYEIDDVIILVKHLLNGQISAKMFRIRIRCNYCTPKPMEIWFTWPFRACSDHVLCCTDKPLSPLFIRCANRQTETWSCCIQIFLSLFVRHVPVQLNKNCTFICLTSRGPLSAAGDKSLHSRLVNGYSLGAETKVKGRTL